MLDLVAELRQELGTAILLISHNLGVIARTCERVGVLYAGRMVEEGADAGGLARRPPSVHGRAAALHPARRAAQGRRPAGHDRRHPPPPGAKLTGCVFVDRCAIAEQVCRDQEPRCSRSPPAT